MIVTSKTNFPKQYESGYKYCLMVNKNNKVTMIWNYNAREYMDIVDKNNNNICGLYEVNKVKTGLKSGEFKLVFWKEYAW